MNIRQTPISVHEIFGGPPPHNIEAEQCLLGAILTNNRAFAVVDALVDEEDFFEPINQEIFRISRVLIREGTLVNPITLKTFLPADLKILNLTISQYLARLAVEATTVINALITPGSCVVWLIAATFTVAEDCAVAAPGRGCTRAGGANRRRNEQADQRNR